MKKVIFSLACCLAALTGCQKDVTPEATNNNEVPCFYATLENGSLLPKTTLNESDGKLAWGAADAIAVFRKQNAAEKYILDTESVGTATGKFTLAEDAKTSEELFDDYVAVYPYNEAVVCPSSESGYEIKVTYPAEQTHNTALFANGLYNMVAVSGDENLSFKNVGGALKLQLKGECNVSTITLTGNQNEPVAGEVVIKTTGKDTPDVKLKGTATSVTLTCDELVQLSSTEATAFYIALPEVTFNGGFTVSVNGQYIVRTENKQVIKRSGLLEMDPIELKESHLTAERLDQKSGYSVPGGKYDFAIKFNTNDETSFASVNVFCADLGLNETTPIQASGSEYVYNGTITVPANAELNKTYTVKVTASNENRSPVSQELSFTVVEGKVYLVGGASISKGKLGKTPAMTQNPENLNEFTTSIWADEGAHWFKFVSSTPDWGAQFNFGLDSNRKIINDGQSATIGLNAQGYYKVTFNMATWEYEVDTYEAPAEGEYEKLYMTGKELLYFQNDQWNTFADWSWIVMNSYPDNPHRFYIDIINNKTINIAIP